MEKKEEGLSYNYRKILKTIPSVKNYMYFNLKEQYVLTTTLNLVDIKIVKDLKGVYVAKVFKDKALTITQSVYSMQFIEEMYYGLLERD